MKLIIVFILIIFMRKINLFITVCNLITINFSFFVKKIQMMYIHFSKNQQSIRMSKRLTLKVKKPIMLEICLLFGDIL